MNINQKALAVLAVVLAPVLALIYAANWLRDVVDWLLSWGSK